MFRPHPTPPPRCHPERSEGSAFLPSGSPRVHPAPRTARPRLLPESATSLPLTSVCSVPSALKSPFAPSAQSKFLSHPHLSPNSFVIRTSEIRPCNPCRIRTSKTQDLKSFRIRTYKKTGEGALSLVCSARPRELRVSALSFLFISLNVGKERR